MTEWNPDKVFKINPSLPEPGTELTDIKIPFYLGGGLTNFDTSVVFDELNRQSVYDDFTGVDGDLPSGLLWDTSAIGTGKIQGNSYYSNAASYITSLFSVSGDFDVEVELEDISHNAAKSWEVRLQAIVDNSNSLHFGLGYTGTSCSSSAKAYFGYKQVAGSWTENGCVLTSNNIGRVKITRVGTVFQTYYLNASSVWTAVGSSVNIGSGNVTFRLESVKWDTNPSYQVSINEFKINSGTIVWPDNNNKKIALMVEGGDECPIEIPPESWDAANKTAMFLATIPGLTPDTVLKFYYDSLHEDNPNVIDVDPLPDPPTDPYELAVYNLGLADGLWTWSDAVVAQIVTMILDQPVALLHLVTMVLDQPVAFPVRMILDQPCRDSAIVRMILDQWVRDLPTVKMVLDQPCGDAKTVRMILDQPVSFPAKVTMILDQPVALGGQLVTMILDQPMALLDTSGLVKMILDQPCSLTDDQAIINHISITVTVGGRTVDPDSISIRVDDQDGYITATIRFPDYEQYAACAVGDEVIITETLDGTTSETTILQVATLTNPEETGAADHEITAISPTIVLDDEPLTEDFGPGIVDVLLVNLCARYGINLDWQGVANWPVLTNELVAADETAMAVLKRVATASGAYLQSLPDGSLRLLPDYPVSIEAWPTADTFDMQLNDQDHIFAIDEQADPREGYNVYLINGQSPWSDKYRLEEETISATVKEIRCYMVPWDDKAMIILDHTGGEWVSIDALDSVILPHMEYIENEQVEIVAGLGNAAYPIDSLIMVNYKQDSLGDVTANYDGSLSTKEVGDALIEISYWTKYIRWRVTDPRAESLQLYIEEVA